jgi:hypothetical protein
MHGGILRPEIVSSHRTCERQKRQLQAAGKADFTEEPASSPNRDRVEAGSAILLSEFGGAFNHT